MKDIVSTGIIKDIKQIIEESKRTVVKNVNTIMLQTYWSIGKRIVEEEQNGNASSNYGDYVIKNLSRELTKEYGRGFSSTNLKMMRRLYSEYKNGQTLSDRLSWSHYLLLLGVDDLNARSFISMNAKTQIGVLESLIGKSIRVFMKDYYYLEEKQTNSQYYS